MNNNQKPILNLFFLFLISLVVFSSSVNAATLGTFPQNKVVTLTQTCSNCTYVNVTRVIFPSSEQYVINQAMNEVAKGNYNYVFYNTSQIGNYVITTCGDPDGTYECEDYRLTIGNMNIYVILILLISGYALLLFSAIFKVPITGFASGSLLTLGGAYMMIYGIGLSNDVYTRGIGFISLFIGLIAAFSATFEIFMTGGEEED